MKAFAFRLEPVLRWRTSQLNAEKAKLESLRMRVEQARAEKQKLLEAVLREKQQASRQSISGSELQRLDAYAHWADEESARIEVKIRAYQEDVQKQTQVVTDCDRNIRLLERLRARRKQEWQEETDRELESLASDFSAAQWSRERNEENRRIA